MAQQTIIWTVLPNGRVKDGPYAGRLCVSIVASPRLTPQAADEALLKAFPDWLDWPATLAHVKFTLRVGQDRLDLEPMNLPDAALWRRLLPAQTPVAGFEFKNMSEVNLLSYSVANVLGLMREHYGQLATQATSTHPTLLPWEQAHPNLKAMLADLGTRVIVGGVRGSRVPQLAPGFDRYFNDDDPKGVEARLRKLVFGKRSIYQGDAIGAGADREGNARSAAKFPLRTLPQTWQQPVDPLAESDPMTLWTSQAEYTLYQANRFYRRDPPSIAERSKTRPDMVNVPPPPPAPTFDFHQITASYADYPHLLRRLGLVIDCVLPVDSSVDRALGASAQVQGLMSLDLAWGVARATTDDACPSTAWVADANRFTTRVRSDDHERGMLRLRYADDQWTTQSRSSFDVYQVDPDGAALKTVNFLLTAQNLVAKSLKPDTDGAVTYTTGDKQAVAALRSCGVGIARRGRAQVVAQNAASANLKHLALAQGSAAARNIVLYTEDVLRGYRVDVQAYADANPQRWQSLCRRTGTYRYSGSQEGPDFPADEGYIKGASTSSSAATSSANPEDHYLHESLFRWAGWSLVVPRPGRTLRARDDPTTGVQTETPEEVKDEAVAGGNGLAVQFRAVPGSLPRLRFGMSYRFRARVVDLAGNSLAFDDAALDDDVNATRPVTYWRFEPLDPPAMVHRARVSAGESLERMVIRSNWNADAASYVGSASFLAALAQSPTPDFEYTASNERHLVPPKSSQLQCETHGQFDSLWSNAADIKRAYEIAAREAGTLFDETPTSHIELVTPRSVKTVATTQEVPPKLPDSENPTGDRYAAGQYVIHREASVQTPYLPDVACGGMALRAESGHVLPGVTGPLVLGPSAAIVQAPNEEWVLMVANAGAWPDAQGFRLVLAERPLTVSDPPCDETYADDGRPAWDEHARVLTLFVPKGRVVRLRYSSFVAPGFIATFGLPQWVQDEREQARVRRMALLGCAWMMTPYRSLVLVHATQQPVCEPQFLSLSADRQPGEQRARLLARIQLHGPSTGKIEVEADWEEWEDKPEAPRPVRVSSHGVLGEVMLPENGDNLISLSAAVLAQMHDPVKRPRARGDDHEFGDARARVIRYRLRATTRFREYLPEALNTVAADATRSGAVAVGPALILGAEHDPGAPILVTAPGETASTLVPASAPPDPPRLLYTVPTFRWSETAGPASLDITRTGNGLRIWLERPWFTSGDGELLGVVLAGENQAFKTLPDPLRPLVTQWGADPLWDSDLPKTAARAADFSARVANEAVLLQEIENQQVYVVGHRVHWGEGRGRWYCDIELDAGLSYMPFLRLALARYQPNAIASAKLSKVVLAEFAQILPRRRARFERQGEKLVFKLHGPVPTYGPMKFPGDSPYLNISFFPLPGQPGESGRNKIELVLQTRDPTVDSDLAWTDVAVLASGTLAPAGSAAPPAASPSSVPFTRPATISPLASQTPAALRDVIVQGLDQVAGGAWRPVPQFPPIYEGPPITDLLDPVIWTSETALPSTGGKPARIAVREYERYYTDSAQREAQGSNLQRRVVEERLVYTAFFSLS